MAISKLRVKLRSYDHRLIDKAARSIVTALKKQGTKMAGPVPLPTEIERFTVLRSPHVNKKSREQFEIRTHKRFIDIYSPTQEVVDALTNLELPAGVDVEIKQE